MRPAGGAATTAAFGCELCAGLSIPAGAEGRPVGFALVWASTNVLVVGLSSWRVKRSCFIALLALTGTDAACRIFRFLYCRVGDDQAAVHSAASLECRNEDSKLPGANNAFSRTSAGQALS